jgi:hypothetical protein
VSGEAADVHLVDDQVLHRPVERPVALPVVVVNVDDDTAHGGCQVVGGPDGIVAVEECLGITHGVGVNQYLIAVEAKSLAVEILWTINAVRVMGARLQAPDIDVPEKESLVGGGFELDDLNGLDGVLPVKEKQLNTGGVAGENREIHSLLIDSSTQGVGSAGLGREWTLRFRLPNIGFPLADGISGCHVKLSGLYSQLRWMLGRLQQIPRI